MRRVTLIGLILIGIFGALTGVFFGLAAHFQNAMPAEICRFIPLNFTDIVESHSVYCEIRTNHTMSCGSWSYATVIYENPCRKFNHGSRIKYEDNYYNLGEYVCYSADCTWDGEDYQYNKINPMIICGVLCGTLTFGAMVWAFISWCGEVDAKRRVELEPKY
nr:hypothetical protein K-LCC10_0443 [Kaumoebavirus]